MSPTHLLTLVGLAVATGLGAACGGGEDATGDVHVVTVTDADFAREVKQADKPVLVDIWAEWCGPCRAMAPIVEAVAADYGNRLKVCKLNVDSNPETAREYQIRSIPALLLFKNGESVAQDVGFKSEKELKAWIDQNL
jgi:thioredoxin 1